jgi:hypothetical protein
MTAFRFVAQNLGLNNVKTSNFVAEEANSNESEKYSYLGTQVFSNLEIPAGKYLTNEGETVDFDGIRIDAVLFDISIEKNIVRTPINGRNGTVKQYISLGDYAIGAKGVIIGETDANNAGFSVSSTGRVPEAEIRKLNAIFAIPQEIELVSEFLDFFDVSTVVIYSGRFLQREGFIDSVYFNFDMLSDTPIELK